MTTAQMKLFPGTALLLLRTAMKGVNDVAAAIHHAWYDKKKAEELDNALHPFRGPIPQGSRFEGLDRVRVRDLTPEERVQLKIADDADAKWDVYHASFYPYAELPTARQKGRSRGPAIATIQILTRKVNSKTTLKDLTSLLENLLLDEPPFDYLIDLREEIAIAIHIAWASGESAYGVVYPDNPDMITYDELNEGTQSYDWYLGKVVIRWLIERIESTHRQK